jgi:hypothetical protein
MNDVANFTERRLKNYSYRTSNDICTQLLILSLVILNFPLHVHVSLNENPLLGLCLNVHFNSSSQLLKTRLKTAYDKEVDREAMLQAAKHATLIWPCFALPSTPAASFNDDDQHPPQK